MENQTLKLHYSPLSTFSQKTLTALHEKGVSFEPVLVNLFTPEGRAAYAKFYPLGKIPVLVVGERLIPESSIIIEYVDTYYPGPRLIPEDRELGRRARYFDRIADNYVNGTFTTIFFDSRKPEAKREPERVAEAHRVLQLTLGYLNHELKQGPWILGEEFTIADCALAPPLAYLRHMLDLGAFPNLNAYLGRLLERPSFAKVLAEAQPYLAAMMGGGSAS